MGAGGSAFGFVTTKSRRAGILPKLQIPDEYIKISPSDEREIIPVLIFNPAPGEVSYVTEEKSSIKIAFSGDEFRGEKIFTPTTFVIWADRKKRQDFNEKL